MSSGPPTPNLGLHTYTDLDDFDYDEVSEDNENTDALLTPTTCTSGTRPTTKLFKGRVIHETDTGSWYFYTGTVWRLLDMDDTGWMDCTVNATFAKMAGSEAPKVRRKGDRVYFKGGYLPTGMTANGSFVVGALPGPVNGISFNPPDNDVRPAGTSSGAHAAVGFIQSSGNIEIRVGPTVSAYFKLAREWLIS